VLAGPDLDAFEAGALEMLCASPYAMIVPERTGATLRGRPIARAVGYRERSRPMVRGAIEVPPDGMPIVLGPDHPTTGGYPVLAVVASDDLDRVFATEQSAPIQFTT
jgi:allophanate hydrolase subunit 2